LVLEPVAVLEPVPLVVLVALFVPDVVAVALAVSDVVTDTDGDLEYEPDADADGVYHLFVSEIAAHCGMSTWARMSFAAHTVSPSPVGPFTRLPGEAGIAIGTFAHNTFYARAGGLHLLYHIGDGLNNASCNPYWACSNGTTPGGHGLRPPSPWPAGSCPPANGGAQVHYSASLDGPWVSFGPVVLGPGGPAGISNPAPLVLANGTVFLMGRTKDSVAPPVAAHNIWLFRAPQWNGTYEFVKGTGVGGSVGVGNGVEFTEDPVLWEGRRGFHALFHSQANVSHGWSADLLHWGWDHNSACAACVDPDGTVIVDHERPRVALDAVTCPPEFAADWSESLLLLAHAPPVPAHWLDEASRRSSVYLLC
jgi:hypothetical protein